MADDFDDIYGDGGETAAPAEAPGGADAGGGDGAPDLYEEVRPPVIARAEWFQSFEPGVRYPTPSRPNPPLNAPRPPAQLYGEALGEEDLPPVPVRPPPPAVAPAAAAAPPAAARLIARQVPPPQGDDEGELSGAASGRGLHFRHSVAGP